MRGPAPYKSQTKDILKVCQNAKKELGQIPAILTSCLVIYAYTKIIFFSQLIKFSLICFKFLDMILENLKEVLMAAQFDRARLMVISLLCSMSTSS